MILKDRVREVCHSVIEDINETAAGETQISLEPDAVLFGKGGSLSSLALVNMIIALEEELNDTFDTNITLASESAMSAKRSPFRSLDALMDYATELIESQSE